MRPRLDRRRFLLAAGGSAAGLDFSLQRRAHATSLSARKLGYPFTLGVASGDPLPDGVVLWTRVAPEPLGNGQLVHIVNAACIEQFPQAADQVMGTLVGSIPLPDAEVEAPWRGQVEAMKKPS